MKTLELFNAVLAKDSQKKKPFISEEGIVIHPAALWAKDQIIHYYQTERLNGNDLNKTFHKSWKKIKDSSRCELLIDQILHYISTYGSDFQDEIYIPDEVLEIPGIKLTYKVIQAYTVEEMKDKCIGLLNSGIALKAETIDDLLSIIIDELDYVFTGKENIRNKEAIVRLAEDFHIYPNSPVEFFRYIIYRSTDNSLLIKNDEIIKAIKSSSYNPANQFKRFGLERLAEIFNRFKPLFLAFKDKAPKTINKISKLSKKHHKPLAANPLNDVTNAVLMPHEMRWLDNATPFSLFKALSACYTRMKGQKSFLYRVRNGKSWVKEGKPSFVETQHNYSVILDHLKTRFDFSDLKTFIPKGIKYALPTSEKLFVGNIPTGTRFYGNKLSVGIYWENAYGGYDLDLSGLNIAGKIGWNAPYKNLDGNLLYSGDITSAPNGAVEYLYASHGLNDPTLVMNNVYSGSHDCGYKIIIGKGGKVSRNHMMDPNNLFAEVKCQSVQKKTVLGLFLPKKEGQCFVLLNFGAGHARVSGSSTVSEMATRALYQQWNKPLTLKKVLKELGCEFVDKPEEADVDLSLDKLEKDTFTKIFSR